MASSVKNVCTKNYRNLSISPQVTINNIEDAFWHISVHFNSYFAGSVFPR